jgi:hypothetical protein
MRVGTTVNDHSTLRALRGPLLLALDFASAATMLVAVRNDREAWRTLRDALGSVARVLHLAAGV